MAQREETRPPSPPAAYHVPLAPSPAPPTPHVRAPHHTLCLICPRPPPRLICPRLRPPPSHRSIPKSLERASSERLMDAMLGRETRCFRCAPHPTPPAPRSLKPAACTPRAMHRPPLFECDGGCRGGLWREHTHARARTACSIEAAAGKGWGWMGWTSWGALLFRRACWRALAVARAAAPTQPLRSRPLHHEPGQATGKACSRCPVHATWLAGWLAGQTPGSEPTTTLIHPPPPLALAPAPAGSPLPRSSTP